MATFQVQIEDLTGSVSDTAALSSWLTDGARSVLTILPIITLERVVSTDAFTNTIDIESKKVFSVVRRDDNHSSKAFMPCRKLTSSMMGRVSDTSYMEAASESDPAYIIQGDVLNTYPGSNQSSDSRVTYINTGITVAYGDSSITNFPDEAENTVVLYAARNSLQRLMNDEAEDVINSDEPSATTDAYGAQANEDTELVTSALQIAQTEITRAQAHLSEWIAIGDMRAKEINSALAEAQGYGAEIQTRIANDNAKYTWYTQQYQMIDAQYKEQIQLLIGGGK
jgi:hypothetical protein